MAPSVPWAFCVLAASSRMVTIATFVEALDCAKFCTYRLEHKLVVDNQGRAEEGEGGVLTSRFQVHSRRGNRRLLTLVCIIVFGFIGIFELYRWMVPFDTLNPLWVQATIGQPVIDNWRYGGQDAEGYLKFYDSSQTILLPPDSRLFDADGWFVVLERHTPSSITFAQPYNAIPLSWFAIGGGITAVPVVYVLMRARSRRGFLSRQNAAFRGPQMRMGRPPRPSGTARTGSSRWRAAPSNRKFRPRSKR